MMLFTLGGLNLPKPPIMVLKPITYGDYLVNGNGITVTDGLYSEVVDISYQWKRAGVNISGATTNTYTPLETDEGAKWWDATYAIRPNGMVIAQLIIFRTKNGYDKYKYDGVTLFDDPYN